MRFYDFIEYVVVSMLFLRFGYRERQFTMLKGLIVKELLTLNRKYSEYETQSFYTLK